MAVKRREFLKYLCYLGLSPKIASGFSSVPDDLYAAPDFGQVTLMHFTDCHAQLLPVYYREPGVNIGVGKEQNLPPHLVGQQFLDFFGIKAGSREAYAFTHLDFVEAATVYGKMGGFAHLATLVKQLRAERGDDNTLLLDGGDSWQGSATALWTKGQDMVSACNQLGVDVMTGHWEFTYGQQQVRENLKQFNGDFVAQNINLTEEAQFSLDTDNTGVFKPYVIKQLKSARIAIIGQAFPYTPIANPQLFVADWQFGIQEQTLQATIDKIRQEKSADVIVLLSHNGMDVDLKLASRVSGLDIILGGHTHDAIPRPIAIQNAAGKTWVSNAGSYGKFLAVLDLDIKQGRLHDLRYRLLPVFANLIPADPEMQALIDKVRQPYLSRLKQPITQAEQLLYRRDTYMGSFDQLILKALQTEYDAEIAFSPGFRWGATFLPGQTITLEDVMSHTAITYPETYTKMMTGAQIKQVLEDVADNLFNIDPYFRQGGDMVRVGGLSFNCNPNSSFGNRIDNLYLSNGKRLTAREQYKTAGWAAVGEKIKGAPVWQLF